MARLMRYLTWVNFCQAVLFCFSVDTVVSKGSKYPTATANLSPSPKNAVDSEFALASFVLLLMVDIGTSDMLIMVWAHATFSGDASLVKAYVRPTLFNRLHHSQHLHSMVF